MIDHTAESLKWLNDFDAGPDRDTMDAAFGGAQVHAILAVAAELRIMNERHAEQAPAPGAGKAGGPSREELLKMAAVLGVSSQELYEAERDAHPESCLCVQCDLTDTRTQRSSEERENAELLRLYKAVKSSIARFHGRLKEEEEE